MMSIVVVIANTLWPSQPPTWEAPGGVLKTYFQNIIGRCDGNKVLVAINKATGIKECANANSLISATNFGLCPANNSYPKLDFTFGSSSVSSKIRLIWSSENTTQCSIPGIPTTATGWSVDVPANNNSYTLFCSGADGSSVSQTLNTTSIWVVGGGIAWPTMNPSGESTWGIFGNYLSNLGWETGKCSSNEVIVGFEVNGKPKCVVASSLMSASSCPGSSDPYINFTATPSNIAPWDPVTLAWQAGNLTSCTTSDAFIVNGSSSWVALIHPTATSTYRITCSDDAGRQMQKSISVTVTSQPINGGWSAFSNCSRPCWGGFQTRQCNNPSPQNSWSSCVGNTTQSCNTQVCFPAYDKMWAKDLDSAFSSCLVTFDGPYSFCDVSRYYYQDLSSYLWLRYRNDGVRFVGVFQSASRLSSFLNLGAVNRERSIEASLGMCFIDTSNTAYCGPNANLTDPIIIPSVTDMLLAGMRRIYYIQNGQLRCIGCWSNDDLLREPFVSREWLVYELAWTNDDLNFINNKWRAISLIQTYRPVRMLNDYNVYVTEYYPVYTLIETSSGSRIVTKGLTTTHDWSSELTTFVDSETEIIAFIPGVYDSRGAVPACKVNSNWILQCADINIRNGRTAQAMYFPDQLWSVRKLRTVQDSPSNLNLTGHWSQKFHFFALTKNNELWNWTISIFVPPNQPPTVTIFESAKLLSTNVIDFVLRGNWVDYINY